MVRFAVWEASVRFFHAWWESLEGHCPFRAGYCEFSWIAMIPSRQYFWSCSPLEAEKQWTAQLMWYMHSPSDLLKLKYWATWWYLHLSSDLLFQSFTGRMNRIISLSREQNLRCNHFKRSRSLKLTLCYGPTPPFSPPMTLGFESRRIGCFREEICIAKNNLRSGYPEVFKWITQSHSVQQESNPAQIQRLLSESSSRPFWNAYRESWALERIWTAIKCIRVDPQSFFVPKHHIFPLSLHVCEDDGPLRDSFPTVVSRNFRDKFVNGNQIWQEWPAILMISRNIIY
jgi:hypothetical protein